MQVGHGAISDLIRGIRSWMKETSSLGGRQHKSIDLASAFKS